MNAVYEESDAEKGDTGDTKTKTDETIETKTDSGAKEEDCGVKLNL